MFDCVQDPIETLTNGNFLLNRTTFGSEVSFICEINHALIGNATRTCGITGWSGSNPSCGAYNNYID